MKKFIYLLLMLTTWSAFGAESNIEKLRAQFNQPDHTKWGMVPFWWWEGETITEERIIWQMETLAGKGVKNLTVIQRAPGHCDPAVFTAKWWEMLNFALKEARRLDMRLWLSDHLGYGETGFMEKLISSLPDAGVFELRCPKQRQGPGKEVNMKLPEGKVLGAHAYPMITGGIMDDANSIDVSDSIEGNTLRWSVPTDGGNWTVAVVIAYKPHHLDEDYVPFSVAASKQYLEERMEGLKKHIPVDMLGKEFAGFFGDEHPPLPQNVYTKEMAEVYREKFGTDIARAIPALFCNLGNDSVKYRAAYFDAAVETTERNYWRPVFEWCQEHGLQYGNDQAQRRNPSGQVDKYIDYVKTMRWYSAPGQDDPNHRPLGDRNFHGFKQAASIAELYNRSRVWNEAFYSSGIGATPADHLAWLTEDAAYGANLYNPHNYFYSMRGGTWTHTDGAWFWRQPYWEHYETFANYVTRLSYLGSEGRLVADVAVHYPAVSMIVENPVPVSKRHKARPEKDSQGFMAVSEALFFSNIDNIVIDDDSLLAGKIVDGKLVTGRHSFSTLAFGPEETIRLSVLQMALELLESGGNVIFAGRLPTGSAENGANDPMVGKLLDQILSHKGGGIAAFFPVDFTPLSEKRFRFAKHRAQYPKLYGHPQETKAGKRVFDKIRAELAKVTALAQEIAQPQFINADDSRVIGWQRNIGGTDVFMIQSLEKEPLAFSAVFNATGTPEYWDPWTGKTKAVEFENVSGGVRITLPLEDNLGHFIVFSDNVAQASLPAPALTGKILPDSWTFELQATLDNRWGDFRLPASEEKIGAEISKFEYRESKTEDWHTIQLGVAPYWECKSADSNDWKPVRFSKKYGANKLVTFRGTPMAAIADGLILPDFIIEVPKGRAQFRTTLVSDKKQQVGLAIRMRQQSARLWVDGTEQPIEYGIGLLPLNKGRNDVLVELENPGRGQLYVCKQLPSVKTVEEAQNMLKPKLGDAHWIRAKGEPDWNTSTFTRTFTLTEQPQEAHITATAFPDYELYVNGTLIEKNTRHYMHNQGSGNWRLPRSANITRLLAKGKNTITAKVAMSSFQYFGDMRWTPAEKRFALALSARFTSGENMDLVTDSDWPGIEATRNVGVSPGDKDVLKNIASAMHHPEYPLNIESETPLLTCFDEVPGVAYDIKQKASNRAGYFRFSVPSGIKEITTPTRAKIVSNDWKNNAFELQMNPGEYEGAAFDAPLKIELKEDAKMPLGNWAELGLEFYSGIGIYRQTIKLSKVEAKKTAKLDLGEVSVSAEVFVNGKSAGIRMCKPFKYDLSGLLKPGDNEIEIRVANTLAPFMSTSPIATRLKMGPSGLKGPVRLLTEQ